MNEKMEREAARAWLAKRPRNLSSIAVVDAIAAELRKTSEIELVFAAYTPQAIDGMPKESVIDMMLRGLRAKLCQRMGVETGGIMRHGGGLRPDLKKARETYDNMLGGSLALDVIDYADRLERQLLSLMEARNGKA